MINGAKCKMLRLGWGNPKQIESEWRMDRGQLCWWIRSSVGSGNVNLEPRKLSSSWAVSEAA